MNVLENDQLRIEINPQGAELTRIYDKTHGLERLWCADPDVWGRHAPVLFPTVGRLTNNQYTFQGKTYALPQHGFARDCTFAVKRETPETVSYLLSDSEATRAVYPFAFALQIDYTLTENQLRVALTVSNPDAGPLYFTIGAHPGFTCPLLPGESFRDYYVEFEVPETCARWNVTSDGLIGESEENYLLDTRVIPYTEDRFREDALVFKDLKSTRIAIKSEKNDHAVTMDFAGWPYFGIWSKAGGAPFICLEPWYGIADHVGHDGDLTEKEGIMPLEGGLNFCCEYGMTFT